MKTGSPEATYGRVAKVGVVWSLLGRGFYEFVQIPAAMITARILTPEQFGVVAAANFFVQVAQRLTNFGINTALLQRKELTDAHKSAVFAVNVGVGMAMWALMALTAPWLAMAFRSAELVSVLPVIGSVFFINAVASVPMALMARDMRFRENAVINAAHATTFAGLGVWLAWGGWGLWSLIWSQVAAALVHAALRLLMSGWWPSLRLSWDALRQLLSFGIGLHFQRLLESAALNVDNLVVGRMLGLSSLGFYDKAFTTMNRAVMLISSTTPAVAFRIFAIIHGDDERFRVAYRKVLLATTFAAYPLLGLLIGLAPEIFFLLFGPQWDAAVLPFQVLCVAGMMKVLITLQGTVAQSTGQVWGEVRRQCLYLILIVGGAGIGSIWGLVGSSVGVLIASVVMSVLMQGFLKQVTALAWRDLVTPQIPAVVYTVGIVILLWLLRAEMVVGPLSAASAIRYAGIGSTLAIVVYLAFMRYSPFAELRDVVREIVEDLLPALGPLVKVKQ